MLVIRYLRIGRKNDPSFKIVVTDKRRPPRGGRFVEILGFYNPITKKSNIKKERVQYWIKNGAQPSDSIHNLLIKNKIIEGKKTPVHSKKKAKEGEKAATVSAPAPATPAPAPATPPTPTPIAVVTPAPAPAPVSPAPIVPEKPKTEVKTPEKTEPAPEKK